MGDFDRDGNVDLADSAELQNCFSGDGPATVSPFCRIFDFEFDGDVNPQGTIGRDTLATV